MLPYSARAARLAPATPLAPSLQPRPGNRVLVPVIRGQSAAALLSIGDAIAADCPRHGVVLSLVEIPPKWSGMVTSAVIRSRELLRWIAATDYQNRDLDRGERLSIHSRFTTNPIASIREALLETACDTIVVEFPPAGASRRHRLEAILRAASEDDRVNLVVVRPDPASNRKGIRPQSILVPLRGGPNAWLALSVALAMTSSATSRLTLMHIYDPRHHQDLLRHEEAVFRELVHAARVADPDVLEIESNATAEVMLDVARHYDAVVLGAHSDPFLAGMLVGEIHTPLIDHFPRTVIFARAAKGLQPAA